METKTKTTAKRTMPTGKTGKMENSAFHEFFIDELKDIYWAENHLLKALHWKPLLCVHSVAWDEA